jgi:hypothetical protein
MRLAAALSKHAVTLASIQLLSRSVSDTEAADWLDGKVSCPRLEAASSATQRAGSSTE